MRMLLRPLPSFSESVRMASQQVKQECQYKVPVEDVGLKLYNLSYNTLYNPLDAQIYCGFYENYRG